MARYMIALGVVAGLLGFSSVTSAEPTTPAARNPCAHTEGYPPPSCYEQVIQQEADSALHELEYADYLRNVRGPKHPLTAEAERHYFEAQRKLEQQSRSGGSNPQLADQIHRGLIALYEQDGLPVYSIRATDALRKPAVFLSSIHHLARSTTDIEETDDVRNFTAEALFASSAQRLNRALTNEELRDILRTKTVYTTSNRIRIRIDPWPDLDLLTGYRHLDDAQITSFFVPGTFNDVQLVDYGLALHKPFRVAESTDLFLSGTFKRAEREGTIEFFPDAEEDLLHYEATAAIAQFVGSDKVIVEGTYVFQDIDPEVPSPERDRQIIAATLTYQMLQSPLQPDATPRRFRLPGMDVFGGMMHDRDRFGAVHVNATDWFVGATLKELGRLDVTLQPTLLTAEVEDDSSQDQAQYRTALTLLYRLLDEEEEPGIPRPVAGLHPAFVHLLVPVKHDVAIDGPADFDNVAVGFEVIGKGFSGVTTLGPTVWLSVGYRYARFYHLDEGAHRVQVKVSMGF